MENFFSIIGIIVSVVMIGSYIVHILRRNRGFLFNEREKEQYIPCVICGRYFKKDTLYYRFTEGYNEGKCFPFHCSTCLKTKCGE